MPRDDYATTPTVEAAVEFSHYSGGDSGVTKDDPHLDLFVYDAEAPDELDQSNAYTFGPAEVNPDNGWVAVDGTSDTNLVEGKST